MSDRLITALAVALGFGINLITNRWHYRRGQRDEARRMLQAAELDEARGRHAMKFPRPGDDEDE